MEEDMDASSICVYHLESLLRWLCERFSRWYFQSTTHTDDILMSQQFSFFLTVCLLSTSWCLLLSLPHLSWRWNLSLSILPASSRLWLWFDYQFLLSSLCVCLLVFTVFTIFSFCLCFLFLPFSLLSPPSPSLRVLCSEFCVCVCVWVLCVWSFGIRANICERKEKREGEMLSKRDSEVKEKR